MSMDTAQIPKSIPHCFPRNPMKWQSASSRLIAVRVSASVFHLTCPRWAINFLGGITLSNLSELKVWEVMAQVGVFT